MKKPRILSIDDDVDFNNLLKTVLKKYPLNHTATSTVPDFITELKVERPDLCLVDLNLDIQAGAGFQLINAVRKSFGNSLPILVLSRRSNQNDIQEALVHGADDFVAKPIDDIILINKMKLFLDFDSEKMDVPFKNVSKYESAATYQISTEISSVGEEEITVKSNFLLSKSTTMKCSGEFILNLFGQEDVNLTVSNSWINSEEEKFYATLKYDEANRDLRNSLKMWLLDRHFND